MKRKNKIIENLEKQVELLQTDLDNKEHELVAQIEFSKALQNRINHIQNTVQHWRVNMIEQVVKRFEGI